MQPATLTGRQHAAQARRMLPHLVALLRELQPELRMEIDCCG